MMKLPMVYWKEPFGMIGTMIAMVWGYLPFVSLAADATYPEEHDFLISEKGLVLNRAWKDLPENVGGYRKIKKNSWMYHLSITYNKKYLYIINNTWIGYQFFGTLSLIIYLLKVSE